MMKELEVKRLVVDGQELGDTDMVQNEAQFREMIKKAGLETNMDEYVKMFGELDAGRRIWVRSCLLATTTFSSLTHYYFCWTAGTIQPVWLYARRRV